MTITPQQLRIDVEGGDLYVESSGDGPPLLMVHGWPLDHRLFGPQVAELANEFRVIVFDRRGFGRSQAPPDLRLELDDIDRILDALGLSDTHLLGMSQGGRIAIRYAVTRPDRLRSLILQGAVIDGLRLEEHESERVPVAEFAALAKAGCIDEVRRRWLSHPMMALEPQFADAAELVDRTLADYAGDDLVDFDPESYRFDMDVLNALHTIPVPTLVLTGECETLARKQHADELCRRIGNAVEVVLENSGHLSNLTAVSEYNRAVREFCVAVEATRKRQDAALLME